MKTICCRDRVKTTCCWDLVKIKWYSGVQAAIFISFVIQKVHFLFHSWFKRSIQLSIFVKNCISFITVFAKRILLLCRWRWMHKVWGLVHDFISDMAKPVLMDIFLNMTVVPWGWHRNCTKRIHTNYVSIYPYDVWGCNYLHYRATSILINFCAKCPTCYVDEDECIRCEAWFVISLAFSWTWKSCHCSDIETVWRRYIKTTCALTFIMFGAVITFITLRRSSLVHWELCPRGSAKVTCL